MKLTVLLFILTAFVLFYSYQYAPITTKEGQIPPSDSSNSFMPIDTTHSEEDDWDEFWKKDNSSSTLDSLYLQKALEQAFKIAAPSFGASAFNSTYTYQASDSSEEVYVEMVVGQLLQDRQQYFLLRRFYSGTDDTYLNLYKIQPDTLPQEILAHVQEGMTYKRDTIFDVNGDQQLDFVIHWHPTAGAWPREIYTLYLNSPQQTSFIGAYTFQNPKFSPKEGLIRGQIYGNPNKEPFYKYQWKGTVVDTVEYIYPHLTQKGKYIKVPQEGYLENLDRGILVDSLPNEYQGF